MMRSSDVRPPALAAAIDFGISNTDVVVRRGGELYTWSQRYQTDPDEASVRGLLATGGVDLDELTQLAVTGGRHRVLSEQVGRTTVVKVNEVQAIGRGGQALLGLEGAAQGIPLMVASCGSGTALIKAQGLTRDLWDSTFDLMLEKHRMAPVKPEERVEILDYLAEQFPPRRRGRGADNPFLK